MIREFIYIKPDVLVIFDRLVATSPDAEATFVLHFPVKPTYKEDETFGKYWIMENGGSQMFARTVYPPDAEYTLVDEGDVEGKKAEPGYYQYRLEVKQKARAECYFMTIVTAQERFDMEPTCVLKETEKTIGMEIKQPGRHSEVHFNKAVGESLGELTIDAAGAYGHSESKLPMRVQGITVGPDGVTWGEPLEPNAPIDPATLRKKR